METLLQKWVLLVPVAWFLAVCLWRKPPVDTLGVPSVLPSTTKSNKNNYKLKSLQHINSVLLVVTVGSHRQSLYLPYSSAAALCQSLSFCQAVRLAQRCTDKPACLCPPGSCCGLLRGLCLCCSIHVNPLSVVDPCVLHALPVVQSFWPLFPYCSCLLLSGFTMYRWMSKLAIQV